MFKKKKSVNDFERSSLTYFKEISKFEPLSKDEELKLWKDYKQNNNLEARNKLITSNLKFVANVAQKYQGLGLSYSDLIAEGNVGLIKALKKFDASKGNKMISYSVWWIRQTILEAIEKRNGLEGEELPCDTEQQDFLDDDSINVIPRTINDDFIISDTNTEFQIEEQKKAVSLLIDTLNERERFIITKYYGLDNEKPKTLEEIGNILGLTKERVRQINEKSLKKLRSEALNKCITSDIYK